MMLAGLAIIAALLTSWGTWRRWRLRRRLPQDGKGCSWHLWLAQGLILAALGTILAGAHKGRVDTPCLAFLFDCSESMRAEGVATSSRLEEGRAVIRKLADACRRCDVALITYAGSAFVDCPPTSDRIAFDAVLEAAGPGVLFLPGSAPEQAVRQAEALGAAAVVLVSDGEMNPPDASAAAMWRARKSPLVAVSCGAVGIPRQIPRKNGILFDESTGYPALSTTTGENVIRTAALSDAPFGGVLEATGDLKQAVAFLQGHVRMKDSSRSFLFYAIALLFFALCVEPVARALKERTLRVESQLRNVVVLLFGVCGFLLAEMPAATDERLEELRAKVRDTGQPAAVRARFYSNLAALLCARASASEAYEAVHAAREALKLEPGLAAAAANLELAQRLLLQDGATANQPQTPSAEKAGEGGEHEAQASGEGEEAQLEAKPGRSFGTWRDLQEAAARRQMRAAPQGVKPW